MKYAVIPILLLITLCAPEPVFSQKKDTCKITPGVSAEFVSRYVWRGMPLSDKPNLQPSLFVTYKNVELGYWGSFAMDGTYDEADLYLSYSFYNFSLILNDYFTARPVAEWTDPRYFCFTDKNSLSLDTMNFSFLEKNTGHALEGMFTYEGGEKFPLKFQVGLCFFGNDKSVADTAFVPGGAPTVRFENNYSVYSELSWPFLWKEYTVEPFLGFTPGEGMYGTGAGIINAGLKFEKPVKLCGTYEIPLKAGVVVNPQTEQIFLFAGFKL